MIFKSILLLKGGPQINGIRDVMDDQDKLLDSPAPREKKAKRKNIEFKVFALGMVSGICSDNFVS